jgi:hypothetical protein
MSIVHSVVEQKFALFSQINISEMMIRKSNIISMEFEQYYLFWFVLNEWWYRDGRAAPYHITHTIL